jgi:hypothetical protein
MNQRRSFLKFVAATGALAATGMRATEKTETPSPAVEPHAGSGSDDRADWIGVVERVATPVLANLAKRELRKRMPVETTGDAAKRRGGTHLEAFARVLVGIAPWLEAHDLPGAEAGIQKRFIELAQTGLDAATDRASPDLLNFSAGGQPLVDAAFLAQAMLRAPSVLWKTLDQRVQQQVIAALKSSRVIQPPECNWILFAALVETALLECGEPTDTDRLEGNLRRMLTWYLGDGVYGDGPRFHFDYYNSFVIHPALVDILGVLRKRDERFAPIYEVVVRRARRFAEIQERLIAPDGTFPVVGRSITYRFGAFQTLAQMAWLNQLPERLKPAQVRSALTAVIRRMIEAPGTFDEQGWLRVGFCGHQLALGETYISTGSLYLCMAGLLPLGLPPKSSFWSDPATPWTSQRIWSGESLPGDHALAETEVPECPNLKR